MSLEKIFVILPCHSLDGYSLDRQVGDADELLSAWSASYHPLLLAQAGALPTWASAQDPPKDPAGSLVMLPQCSKRLLTPEWVGQASGGGARIVEGARDRGDVVQAALEQLGSDPDTVDPELAADFLALGFCHMQIELLIRDAGYDMGNDVQYYDEQYYGYGTQFDRGPFETETLAAAAAALEGREQSAREHLGTALKQLTEARQNLPYTYSADVDPHLIDLTLVAPTTLGTSLGEELAKSIPTNLLLSGEVLEQMARQEPAILARLREAADSNRVVIIGGEYDEAALPLLALESIAGGLRRGLATYQRHLGRQPAIFGRRRFGLSPVLPQILRKFGVAGAVHFTLDDGRFPTSSQSKIWWVGLDGTEVEALSQLPLDAARPANFLNFAGKVSNTSYSENNATVVLAHWPGRSCRWYRDLQRIAAYSPVLGQFRTITEYLEQSQSISQWTRAGPDEYRSPYLTQAVARQQPDPISCWVRHHRRRAAADALEALTTLADLTGRAASPPESRGLPGAVDHSEPADPSRSADLDEPLQGQLKEAAGRFLSTLPRHNAAAEEGYVVANPWSFARRVLIDVSGLPGLPKVAGAVRAAGESAGRKQVVVDVPPMGFAWIGAAPAADPSTQAAGRFWWKTEKKKRKPEEPPMAEENVLRNDRFEVTVNPVTGAIQSIYDYVSRGNRLAQQIALRLPRSERSPQAGATEDDFEKDYSLMAADEISVTSSGPVLGEIVCRGRLVARDGRRVARYVQTMQAWRGSPVLELQIDLDIERQPAADPWSSYYAARFAWGDAAADVYRGVQLANRPTERNLLEAPHFVDIRSDPRRVTILTGGLPYHRRLGLRKLDTLLVVHGETSRSFRLGIGIDLAYPVPAALDFLAREHLLAQQAPRPAADSGWLFHVDAKNVVATHWEPLWSDGRVMGFRVRLLETEGRRCRVGIRSFRTIRSARKSNFLNEPTSELSVRDDKVTVEVGAHEWAQVEAEFAG